jgi:hypothetical protein
MGELCVFGSFLGVFGGQHVEPAPGEALAIPNDKVYSQDKHTTAQAIYNTNVKSDDKQTVKIVTRLAIR